jgi:hypothetical protein
MEPVFMILGQSAATAACLAGEAGSAVQDVDYQQLRERLLADGQVLEWHGKGSVRRGLNPRNLKGVVLDDTTAELTGGWFFSSAQGSWVGAGYLHDDNTGKGEKSARFTTDLEPGRYEVRLAYAAYGNRATNVPVTVRHAEGETRVTVDQQQPGDVQETFVSLGTFRCGAESTVLVETDGTDGHVIVDAVQFVPVDQP